MTDSQNTRRSFIRSAAFGLGLGALATPVAGRKSGQSERTSLVDGPAEYRIYIAESDSRSESPNTPAEFDYPNDPVLASEDPADGGLFDASAIEKTPNGETLHHSLQFFQGLLMRKERGKPYVMVHQGDGRFVSKGQSVNFEARTTAELETLFEQAGFDSGLTVTEPFATLAGGRWRAIARDIVQFLGDPETSQIIAWSLTRVDFFTRGRGRPSHELSALYAIYPNVDEDGNSVSANPRNPEITPMPGPTRDAGEALIAEGRPNLGGQ
ncbi:hypothetical protein [Halobellus captivus]|uniref:hypothetical protein n=1 Tax=Halobellus captivus TaxID=2592614 RepID=UPI00119ECC51|nr:hypothetical protein [Halobellus captivus]